MNYDPLNENYNLVVTNKTILIEAMKLFAEYRTTEYYRFETLESCKNWLELSVNRCRTKICVFLPMDDVKTCLPKSYYQDMLTAEPIVVGCWKNPPKFLVGELAVYCPHAYIPMFPIYTSSQGNDFCVIGEGSCGLYRSISTTYIANKEIGIS